MMGQVCENRLHCVLYVENKFLVIMLLQKGLHRRVNDCCYE